MALNYGALDLLKTIGDFDVTGLSRFSEDHESFVRSKETLEAAYPDFHLLPFPMRYDRHRDGLARQLVSHAKGMGMYLSSSLGFISRRVQPLDRRIRECDHFFFNGGNALFSRGFRDLARLIGIAYPLHRAHACHRPIAFLPQSIPAASGLGRWYIRRHLESARFVSFRESASLKQIDLRRQDAVCTLDLAFFMEGRNEDAAREVVSRYHLEPLRFVPIVPRATTLGDQAYLDPPEYDRTVDFVVHLCESVVQAGHSPLLVVQVETDLRVARDCQRALASKGHAVCVVEEYDPLTLRALYALSRAVFTMRLHAAIFALSVGTVVLGFSRSIWGRKMPGVFECVGIPNLCFQLSPAQSGDPDTTIQAALQGQMDHERDRFLRVIQGEKDRLRTQLQCLLK
ncbi:MAG: polysaccharide pyruvyl transferase family protein [Phycisphaerales bacterium]